MEKVANTNVQKAGADKSAEFKAKKAEAAKKCIKRKKERAAAIAELSKFLLDKVNEKKITILSDEQIALLNSIANPTVTRSTGGSSLLNKAFGDSPKVGDSVTLLDFMKKTMKSKTEMDRFVKKAAEKGIVIEFAQKPNMLESTYTIKKLA